VEQEDPAPKYSLIHIGEIREKLSSRGYYISPLGLITEIGSDYNKSRGDIRYIHGLRGIFHKEEVIVSRKITKERNRLIRILEGEKIKFRMANVKEVRNSNVQTQQLAVQD
jgi:hypothetical protein